MADCAVSKHQKPSNEVQMKSKSLLNPVRRYLPVSSVLFGVVFIASCLHGQVANRPKPEQSLRTYIPESSENTARGVPALFETWGITLPHWSGQALIGAQDNPSNGPLIYTIDKDGRRNQFSFMIPDSGIIFINDFAIRSDGTVALVGGASTRDSRVGSFVALVSPDRKSQTITRTWPYVPHQVAFIPDGSMWTVGYTFHDTEDRLVKLNVMSHYDRGGKLLGSFQLTARAKFGPRNSAADHSFLRTSSDRMGWLSNGLEYIEFSFDGRELQRYGGPEVPDVSEANRLASFALSAGGQVVFGTILKAKRETWELDREKRLWAPISIQDETLPKWGSLLGFDGTILVITGQLHELRRYKPEIQINTH
jgi:hypothetical protein